MNGIIDGYTDTQNIIDKIQNITVQHNNITLCYNCKYYEGVHGTPGHAPCSFWKSGGVLWNDFCSNAERYNN